MSEAAARLLGMTRFHPWRVLRNLYPHVEVDANADLPVTQAGLTDCNNRVWINRRLTQASRRTTLTHELCHIDNGPLSEHPEYAAREERAIEHRTARLLLTVDDLIDALVWNRGRIDGETAEDLWVDLPILLTFIKTLTDDERAIIDAELERRS